MFPWLLNEKDPESPATTSNAWDMMVPFWQMADTLLAGTSAMRAAGETYLPRHEFESNHCYGERLSTATLFNAFELTLEQMVGRPFSDPVTLSEDVPENLEALTHDIDALGTDITTFCRTWFREGIAKGMAHVYVDMQALQDSERKIRTKADDIIEKRRPYWNLVEPHNVIFAAADQYGALQHVRIAECVSTTNGFAEAHKYRIRVLEPGYYAVYEWQKQPSSNIYKWVKIEEGNTTLSYIPLITFYSNKPCALMMNKPPLQDLAYMNVTHWQSSADQRNILTVSRFPMLAGSGVQDPEGAIPIGPRQFLYTSEPTGKFYYVTHDGKSVETGRQDLLDLEDRMTAYGSLLMTRKTGNASATAKALDSAESCSQLEDMALRFNAAINAAWSVTSDFLKEQEPGRLSITTDFGPEEALNIDFQTLNFIRGNGDLSRRTMWLELKRRGTLSDEFDPEEEAQTIEQEIKDGVTMDPMAALAAPGAGGSPNRGTKRGTQQGDESVDDAASGSMNSKRGSMKAAGSADNKGAS